MLEIPGFLDLGLLEGVDIGGQVAGLEVHDVLADELERRRDLGGLVYSDLVEFRAHLQQVDPFAHVFYRYTGVLLE